MSPSVCLGSYVCMFMQGSYNPIVKQSLTMHIFYQVANMRANIYNTHIVCNSKQWVFIGDEQRW